jgi:hypothetical protein
LEILLECSRNGGQEQICSAPYLKCAYKWGEVGHTCDPSTLETETEGSQVQEQPALYRKTLLQVISK